MGRSSHRLDGFTLVEMLVALMIMSMLSVLAYSAFDGLLSLNERNKEQFLQENRRSVALSIVLADLMHVRSRPIRDALGGVIPAYLAPTLADQIEFTRGGLPHFLSMPGGLQRVAYRVEDGKLIRTVWEVLDRTPLTQRMEKVLADGVAEMRVEQMDRHGVFVDRWPPAQEVLSAGAVPSLVRITLVLKTGEEDTLLVPGPDIYLELEVGRDDGQQDT